MPAMPMQLASFVHGIAPGARGKMGNHALLASESLIYSCAGVSAGADGDHWLRHEKNYPPL